MGKSLERRIEDYIETWKAVEGRKPCNDPAFIKDFIEYIKGTDADCWQFSGENGYCGFTAELTEHPNHIRFGISNLDFEFAYRDGMVKVFTLNHNGFWTPEYISLENQKAKEISEVIKSKLIEWAGF